jgi:5-methylcytosine-specific restriction protein B
VNIDERRNQFRNWAYKTVKHKTSIDNYIKCLDKDFPEQLNNIDTIFRVDDITVLKSLHTRCSTKGDLNGWSMSIRSGDPMAAVGKYIKFLQLPSGKQAVKEYVEDINTPSSPHKYNRIKNIILYGSPGVGKTHNTKKLISLIESRKSEKEIFQVIKNNELNDGVNIDHIKNRVKFITFHQSFGYEDFIEGFRPNENGDIKLQDGIFKTICDDVSNDRNNNYYLVIDEINRGNISKIFGELITLIEEDKRDTLEVTLPYSKKPFKIPSNLYIIGTMNSTDKSIALIDIALRRRFTFLKMEPNLDLVDNAKARNIMKQLNEKITDTLGADYVLGHSYFMKIENDDDLEFVLEYKIKPLLEEYFYGDEQGLMEIMKICKVTTENNTNNV